MSKKNKIDQNMTIKYNFETLRELKLLSNTCFPSLLPREYNEHILIKFLGQWITLTKQFTNEAWEWSNSPENNFLYPCPTETYLNWQSHYQNFFSWLQIARHNNSLLDHFDLNQLGKIRFYVKKVKFF